MERFGNPGEAGDGAEGLEEVLGPAISEEEGPWEVKRGYKLGAMGEMSAQSGCGYFLRMIQVLMCSGLETIKYNDAVFVDWFRGSG